MVNILIMIDLRRNRSEVKHRRMIYQNCIVKIVEIMQVNNGRREISKNTLLHRKYSNKRIQLSINKQNSKRLNKKTSV